MPDLYGLPQPLTGSEMVTLHQEQNGNLVLCSMPLSELLQIINLTSMTVGLPTVRPTTSGIVWNNGGALSIS